MDFPKTYARGALRMIVATLVALGALILALSCSEAKAQAYYTPNPAARAAAYQEKVFWFAGGVCYAQRRTHSPEFVTYVTTRPESMTIAALESCLIGLKKAGWQKFKQEPVTTVMVESLRHARTEHMTCSIAGQVDTPFTYQVRFSSLSFTRKGEELGECMSKAAEAEDVTKHPPPQCYAPPFPVPPTARKPLDGNI